MKDQKTHIGIEIALLGLLAILWGSSYLFIKIALDTIPPVTLIAMRVTAASLFLLAFLAWRGVRLPRDTRSWRRLFIQAIFNSIGSWTVLAWGQQYVDSGLAGVLNSTSPVFVFFITLFFTKHEATSSMRLMGACLGISGVTLIVGIDAVRGIGQQVAAQLAVLFGAMLYAGAAIHGKQLSCLAPAVSAAGTMIWATLFLVPMSILIDRPWQLDPSLESISAAIVLAILCTGVALLLYFRLVKSLGSIGVASQSYLRAGVGVVLGVTILGEQITLSIGVGLIAIILGVAAINAPLAIGKKPAVFKKN
jgi:drug/metabolite transporter (DMT)-like permease